DKLRRRPLIRAGVGEASRRRRHPLCAQPSMRLNASTCNCSESQRSTREKNCSRLGVRLTVSATALALPAPSVGSRLAKTPAKHSCNGPGGTIHTDEGNRDDTKVTLQRKVLERVLGYPSGGTLPLVRVEVHEQ